MVNGTMTVEVVGFPVRKCFGSSRLKVIVIVVASTGTWFTQGNLALILSFKPVGSMVCLFTVPSGMLIVIVNVSVNWIGI